MRSTVSKEMEKLWRPQMDSSRKLVICATMAVLLLGAAGRAKENPDISLKTAQPKKAKVGVGVICDTDKQAEQYVSLRATGQSVSPAVNKVNAAAHQEGACGVAAIVYVPNQTMDTKSVGRRLIEIVCIKVLAGYSGSGWQKVSNIVQYAVIATRGVVI
jgi:hypothetical protein